MKRPMVTMALAAIAVATLLDTDDAMAAAQQIRYAAVRVPVVDALQPVATTARWLGLDAPAHALARAAGNPPTSSTDSDPNGLAARARTLAARPRAAPSPSPSAAPGPPPIPYLSDGPPGQSLPAAAAGRPLRVLVTGDSTAGEPGYALTDLLTAAGRGDIDVRDEPYTGTGLTRPGAFDWSRMAIQQTQAEHPDVVVVFLGENDGYPLSGASPYSPEWTDQYAARVQAVIDAYRAGGVARVIWAAPPIDAQTSPWEGSNVNQVFQNIGTAIRRVVATVPGTATVDQYQLFSVDGHFSHPVPDPTTGTVVDARAADGSHLTRAGGAIVARLLLRHLDRDRLPPTALAAPATPNPATAGRPAASPSPAGSAPPADELANGRLVSHTPAAPAHRSTAPYTYSVLAALVLFRLARRTLTGRGPAIRAAAGAIAAGIVVGGRFVGGAVVAGAVVGGLAASGAALTGAVTAGRTLARAAARGRTLARATPGAVACRVPAVRSALEVVAAATVLGARVLGYTVLSAVVVSGQTMAAAIVACSAATGRGLSRGAAGRLAVLRRIRVHRGRSGRHRLPPAPLSPPRPAAPPWPGPLPLPSIVMVDGTIHHGAFCSLEGSWGKTADGRLLRCTGSPDGQRPRWRAPV